MKTYISILIFSLILFDTASACSCGGKPSIQDNWKYASQVFIGEVVDIDTSGNFYSTKGQKVTMFTIRILESFKVAIFGGYNYRTFIYISGGSCDKYFDVGKKYLIYASGNSYSGFLESSSCSRTDLIDRISENEIGQLRKFYQELNEGNINPELITINENFEYQMNLVKAINEKLSHEKGILVILSSTLATIIILTLIIFYIRRRKTNA